MEPEAVLTKLRTNGIRGLVSSEAATRLLKNGPNCIPPSQEYSLWVKFLLSFLSGFSPLLWFAAFFVFLSWKPFGTPPSDLFSLALAIVLLVVIFLSGLFNFYQEVVAAQVMSSIDSIIPTKCIVERDGNSAEIDVRNIVVGDIVSLQSGMKIPADVRLIENSSLRVDTSMLTGEQEPLKMTVSVADKDTSMLQATNIGFMGCNVVEGQGKGVVVATGKETQLSKIATQVNNAVPTTGLQRDLNQFVVKIGIMSVTTVIAVSIVWGAYLHVYHSSFLSLGSYIANAISVLVALVPEGLPLAMSMGLSIIANRLCQEHKVIVKQLSIVETIGSMSVLASDKTGTLTQNKMTVTNLIIHSLLIPIEDLSTAASGSDGGLPGSPLLLFAQLGALFCNQAKVEDDSTSHTPRHSFESGSEKGIQLVAPSESGPSIIGGNGVDIALMKWILAHSDLYILLKDCFSIKAVIPFSSATKISAVVIANSSNRVAQQDSHISSISANPKYFAHVILKGAPEYVLSRCSAYLQQDGSEVALTPEVVDSIRMNIDVVASKGSRVIAMAKASLDPVTFHQGYVFKTDGEPNFPLSGLTFICCVAVSDPPREGVRQAVEDLRRAGVKIAMVTGDAPNTAMAIARQVGLVTHSAVLDSATLRKNSSSNGAAGPSDEENPASSSSSSSSELIRSVEGTGCSGGSGSRKEPSQALLIVGADLDYLGQAEWDIIVQHGEIVFSRVTPDQKLLIVKEFQSRGERVGVTGDGVNDSPALKRADVGIAMNSGSEVAKDAAHVILLEDDFKAIVKGVEEGRLIFVNLQKVIAYQISAGSYSELLPVLATFFLGMPQPLSSFLMIIICCMTDVYAGVALTRETAEASMMTLPPRNLKTEPLVPWSLISYSYLFYGTLESIAAFAAYFMYMSGRGPHIVPNPVPADDDGTRTFPAGYPPEELIFAWNWQNDAASNSGSATGNLGMDNTKASITASSVFFIVLIVCQWGHLVSVRRHSPYFSDSILDTRRNGGSLWSRLKDEILQSTPKPSIVVVILAVSNFCLYMNVFKLAWIVTGGGLLGSYRSLLH